MRPGAPAAAGLALAALVLRWQRLPRRVRALGATALLVFVAWGSGLVHPPNLETIARDLGATLGSYTYAVVGLMALLETGAGIGLVAPGELAVVIGGITAGLGHTDLAALIAIVWACALSGDLTSYFLGRRLGREFLLRHGHLVKLTPARLAQVEAFLERHGGEDDHRRPLHRRGTRARAVRRGVFEDARSRLHSRRDCRVRALVGSVCGTGLRVLAFVRPGRGDRQAGHARAPGSGRGDHRADRRLPNASHCRRARTSPAPQLRPRPTPPSAEGGRDERVKAHANRHNLICVNQNIRAAAELSRACARAPPAHPLAAVRWDR